MTQSGKIVRAPVRPLVLCVFFLVPVTAAPGGQDPQKAIQHLVAAYRDDCRADVGLHVIRLADGKTLCDIRSAEPFLPASNQKILTSAVALKRLGADFSFRTKLALAGKDVVVIGDGDPTTGDARLAAARNETIYAVFDRWAKSLKNSGLKTIDGDLVIRAGLFQRPHFHPDWPASQRQSWYAAPVAAVNFNDNCLDIGFEVQDKAVRPVVTPLSRIMRITSRVRLGKRHLWHCRFDRTGRGVTLTGSVTQSTPDPLSVAVPNPPMLFACVMADRLIRAGIEIKGKLVVSTDRADAAADPEGLRIVAAQTTGLAEALWRANKHSLNMTAECLLLRSAVAPGEPASWPKAAEVATQVLQGHYGLAPTQFTVADGSGLSRRNRAAAAALTALLRAMAAERQFVRSLAVAGIDGSLSRRLTGSGCRGRILAKTGSLAGVSALSGYVLDRAEKPVLAFSILVNGQTRGKRHTARSLQDAVCKVLIRAVDQPTTTTGLLWRPGSEPSKPAAAFARH